jgi:putative tricarboxylic transport membrane protein
MLLGVLGLWLVGLSLFRPGESLGRWPLRGPLLIALSVVAFALAIRTPGLAVAGPAAMLVAGAASPETRWRELAVFSAAVTAVCILLFRSLLHLPIPILVIPGWVVL